MPDDVESEALKAWQLLPTQPDWSGQMQQEWQISEAGAQQRLEDFIANSLNGYKENRNVPAGTTTSKLSPYLHWGLISPGQIVQRVRAAVRAGGVNLPPKDVKHFFSELGWREFSYHLLYHYPDLPTTPLQKRFDNFPWRDDAAALKRWQKGLTGYPLVDAGMRELWATGWMHNRVRMVVGSFLVKHLLLHWHHGEAWFWDTLVDANLQNNSASWQWIAGCGADAAPYFRVFNPILQSKKFDPEVEYIRKWVPELAKLPNRLIHTPWEANPLELQEAGIILGTDYPEPIIDADTGRKRALAAYDEVKG